jgi:ADP-ribose pyrophosphatase
MENDNSANPWKILRKVNAYENPWIRVDHHDVIHPSGDEGIYGVVHFKNLAIGIVPVDEMGNTWLVGQFRFPLEQYSWEIPEGGGSREIEPLVSAQRELQEETGIIAEEFTELFRMHLSNSATDELAIVYLATKLEFGKSSPESSEELMIKKVHLTEFISMAMNGEITDSLSVAAAFRLNIMMLEGKFPGI